MTKNTDIKCVYKAFMNNLRVLKDVDKAPYLYLHCTIYWILTWYACLLIASSFETRWDWDSGTASGMSRSEKPSLSICLLKYGWKWEVEADEPWNPLDRGRHRSCRNILLFTADWVDINRRISKLKNCPPPSLVYHSGRLFYFFRVN